MHIFVHVTFCILIMSSVIHVISCQIRHIYVDIYSKTYSEDHCDEKTTSDERPL